MYIFYGQFRMRFYSYKYIYICAFQLFRVKPAEGVGYPIGAVLTALKTVFYRRQRFDETKTMKMYTTTRLVKYSRILWDIAPPPSLPRISSDIRFYIFNNNNTIRTFFV